MIYDISQPVFGCEVFPSDPEPEKIILNTISNGGTYNLTAFSMCAHNGTHVDAPYHFFNNGKSVDQIGLDKFVGPAFVKSHEGNVAGKDALQIISMARSTYPGSEKRILIKGKATVTAEATEVFAENGVCLIGNESQTVGPEDAPAEVHRILLDSDIVILEGIRLGNVCEGAYILNCAPINLQGSDGAPCRAILVSIEKRKAPDSNAIRH